MKITKVTNENIHEIIPKYIDDNKITIVDIDDIIDTYVAMVKDKFLFVIDSDLLKDILVNITYMYSPNDDLNKDRVVDHLTGNDSDSDDDSDDKKPATKHSGKNAGKNAGTSTEECDDDKEQ